MRANFFFFLVHAALIAHIEAGKIINFNTDAHSTHPQQYATTILAARRCNLSPTPKACYTKVKESVFVYAKCPNKCSNLFQAFSECSPRFQFGCHLVLCESGGAKCQLKPEPVVGNTVCPGNKIMFHRIQIKGLQTISYGIDLSANPLETDFYILFDTTAGMRAVIEKTKAKVDKLLSILARRPDATVGIGYYRNANDEGLSIGFQNVREMTSITNNQGNRIEAGEEYVKRAIYGLEARGGLDVDNANLIALYKVATDPTIGWRERSRKIIIMVGNRPGNEPSCVIPRLTITRESVVAVMKTKRMSVIVANFGQMNNVPQSFGCAVGSAEANQARDIAVRTMGVEVMVREASMLCKAIQEGLDNLPKVFAVEGSTCDPYIDSVHIPPLPLSLLPGGNQSVENIVSIRPGIWTSGNSFSCRYMYTESGAALPTAIVRIKGILPF